MTRKTGRGSGPGTISVLKNSQSVLTKDNLNVPRAPSLQRSVGTFSTEEKGSRLTVRNQREAATNLAEASYLN